MEPKNELISLYDYLGRAAGGELGKKVAEVATIRKETMSKRRVENVRYKGEIILYRREFLQDYFNEESKKK